MTQDDWMPFGRLGSIFNVVVCSTAVVISLIVGLAGDVGGFTIFWLALPLDLLFVAVLIWRRVVE
jgi:hypothetical protein